MDENELLTYHKAVKEIEDRAKHLEKLIEARLQKGDSLANLKFWNYEFERSLGKIAEAARLIKLLKEG